MNVGHLFMIVGVVHELYTVSNAALWGHTLKLLSEGWFGAVEKNSDAGRGTVFFHTFGFMLIALGVFLHSYIAKTKRYPPGVVPLAILAAVVPVYGYGWHPGPIIGTIVCAYMLFHANAPITKDAVA
eukprot:TRINITY_DN12066_c0_g1_i1.p1 TRINITY_DN12066_c0_g1~~TRINITY_DN12066_c0_g1_i1.p1  ORF type:complete len:134 (-),score=14.91 TRINITY_DN12066_c0_g1_i1:6-386(-)